MFVPTPQQRIDIIKKTIGIISDPERRIVGTAATTADGFLVGVRDENAVKFCALGGASKSVFEVLGGELSFWNLVDSAEFIMAEHPQTVDQLIIRFFDDDTTDEIVDFADVIMTLNDDNRWEELIDLLIEALVGAIIASRSA